MFSRQPGRFSQSFALFAILPSMALAACTHLPGEQNRQPKHGRPSAESMTEDFLAVAFGTDRQSDARQGLVRWTRPVRVAMTWPRSMSSAELRQRQSYRSLAALISSLQAVGIDIDFATEPDGRQPAAAFPAANLFVHFQPENRAAAAFTAAWPFDAGKEIYQKRAERLISGTQCRGDIWSRPDQNTGSKGEAQGRTGPVAWYFANVWINIEKGPLLERRCAYEEVMQALGLTRDTVKPWPSIFSNRSEREISFPSEIDFHYVQLLYSKDLKPGDTRQQVRPIALRYFDMLEASKTAQKEKAPTSPEAGTPSQNTRKTPEVQ